MTTEDRLFAVLCAAIDQVNEMTGADCQIPKDPEAELYGKNGVLDSLGLVNLIAATEEKIEDEFNASLNILGQDPLSDRDRRFETVRSYMDFVSSLLN